MEVESPKELKAVFSINIISGRVLKVESPKELKVLALGQAAAYVACGRIPEGIERYMMQESWQALFYHVESPKELKVGCSLGLDLQAWRRRIPEGIERC